MLAPALEPAAEAAGDVALGPADAGPTIDALVRAGLAVAGGLVGTDPTDAATTTTTATPATAAQIRRRPRCVAMTVAA
jgi:hypothetical protein